jgi:hypothetical protein
MKLFASLAVPLVLLIGCSGGSSSGVLTADPDSDAGGGSSGADASTPEADGATPPASASSPNGALQIVSLTSTVGTLTGGKPKPTETEAATFVAIVTDTSGLDAIAGGQLQDETGATYGAFGAGANKGTYTASVAWALVNQVRPIDFTGNSGKRTFSAKFYDNSGNVATASVEIALACRDTKYGLIGACGGDCADTESTGAHCGACGKACAAGQVCKAGACAPAAKDECIDRRTVVQPVRCLDVCAAAGKACLTGLRYWPNPGCTGSLFSGDSYPCDSAVYGDLQNSATSFRCRCN